MKKSHLQQSPGSHDLLWIIKILCTTVGETAADFLNIDLNLGLTGTTVVVGVFLLIVLFFQFRIKALYAGHLLVGGRPAQHLRHADHR